MRRALHLAAAAALAAAPLLLAVAPATAAVPSNVATYGSHAYATAVHVIFYTDAYPNFSTGAIDNHYPLAKVAQDSSPLADATATFSDVGPLGQTVLACSDPSQCANRPSVPYANAHYPGGKAKDHVDSCTPSAASGSQSNPCPTGQAAAYADTAASELSADSSGVYAGGGTQPFAGAEGDSHTVVKPDGSLAVTTHSAVLSASFAEGQVQISKVEVTTQVTATAAGVATGDAHVTVGQVLVNGQPTKIDDQGVTVQHSQVVGCSSVPTPPPAPPPLGTGTPSAPACVPQVETETVKVYTVAPQKTVGSGQATVAASGLHVLVTQPNAVPGAPAQRVEYVFAEGYAQGQLMGGSADTGAIGGSSFDTSAGGFGDLGSADAGADLGTPADAGAAPEAAGPAAQHVAAVLSANRRPLALLFLCWECLLMAAASAWVWSRRVRGRLALGLEGGE